MVQALQALRGVGLMAAATLVAKLGDIARFTDPRQIMTYLGLVPSSTPAAVPTVSQARPGGKAADDDHCRDRARAGFIRAIARQAQSAIPEWPRIGNLRRLAGW